MEQRFNENHNLQIEIRGDQQSITGLASVFYNGKPETEYRLWEGAVERIQPTAFDSALTSGEVVSYYNHDSNYLLGKRSSGTLELRKTANGLEYSVKFDATDPDHQKVVSKIKRGDISGSSFQFQVRKDNWKQEGNTKVRYIEDVNLIEVGPVNQPAYSGAGASFRTVGEIDEAKASYEKAQTEAKLAYLKTI